MPAFFDSLCNQFSLANLLQSSFPWLHLHMQRLLVLLRLVPAAPVLSRLQMCPRNFLERALGLHVRTPVHVVSVVRWLDIARRRSMVARPSRITVAVMHIVLVLRPTIRSRWRDHRSSGVARWPRRHRGGAKFDVACAVGVSVGIDVPGVDNTGLGLLASEEWFAAGAGGVVV